MTVIDLVDLQRSVNTMFAHILHSGLRKIELTEQYYWMINPNKKYDMSSKPTDVVVGDLEFDLEVMKNAVSSSSDALAYNLALIAPLLVYIGEEAAHKLSPQGG